MIALVERLARQHGEGDERDRGAERAEAVDQAGATEDRRSEAEAGGDRQEAEGGDGELGRDAEDARQRHRRPIEHQRRRRVDLDDVAIGRRAVEPFLVDGDEPRNVAEQAEAPLQQDRGDADDDDRRQRGRQAAGRRAPAGLRQRGGGSGRHRLQARRAAASSRPAVSPAGAAKPVSRSTT